MAYQQQKHRTLFTIFGDTAAAHVKETTIINQRINSKNGFHFEVTESPKDFINRVGIEMVKAIHSALDDSVTPRVSRPKTRKFFWDAELQHLADIRQQCYTASWKRNKHNNNRLSLIGSTHLWDLYQQVYLKLKKAIKAAKRRHWKKFCNDMSNSSSNQVYSVLKRLRKKHTTVLIIVFLILKDLR